MKGTSMDRKIFFDHVRISLFSGSLSTGQAGGMTAILDEWDKRKLGDVRWLAYMLATTFHETARTMQPIAEYGGARARYAPYFGRGFVQCTWLVNYKKLKAITGVDVVTYPNRAMELPVALVALFDGMLQGWYTSKKLADYIHGTVCDYVGARRIINGTDRAQTIAGYAQSFESALRAAVMGTVPQPDTPPVILPPVEPPAPKPKPPLTPAQRAAGGAAAVVVAGGVAAASNGHPWAWAALAGIVIVFIVVAVIVAKRKGASA
jgi:putative chitinase